MALRLFPGVSFPLLRWLLAGTHLCTSDALGAGMHSAPVLTAAAPGLWRGVGYTAGSRGCCCFSSDGSPFSCTRSPSHCSHTGGPSSLLGISSAKGQRSRCPPTAVLWPRLASRTDLRYPASRTGRKINPCGLSHPAYGILLRRPRPTLRSANTKSTKPENAGNFSRQKQTCSLTVPPAFITRQTSLQISCQMKPITNIKKKSFR